MRPHTGVEMLEVECVAVLDGRALLPDQRVVPWGAVIVRRLPSDYRSLLQIVDARVHRIVYRLERLPDVLETRPLAVLRTPALFVGCLALNERGLAATITPSSLIERSLMDARREFPEGPPSHGWLTDARRILHESYGMPVRMNSIAARVAVHPVHVSRGFSERYGVTMTRYLRDLRLARASELLATTDHPLSRIALATGFADHAHFTRVFTESVGAPPSVMRRFSRARRVA